MGQNCIAGTTEYDEENGIGLVMYIESGNNMIVWKMSDGTKQGTTVPVSSDYQNMLRTAFENKTGTTIGYFIFHPYNEDTIDIESSITINSDEPVQSNKYAFAAQTSQSGNNYIIGVVDETHYKVYCTTNGNEIAYLINETGEYVNTIDISATNIKSYIVSQLKAADVQIEDIVIDKSVDYERLSTIPDWADYTKIVP
jgi:hypothetical protein